RRLLLGGERRTVGALVVAEDHHGHRSVGRSQHQLRGGLGRHRSPYHGRRRTVRRGGSRRGRRRRPAVPLPGDTDHRGHRDHQQHRGDHGGAPHSATLPPRPTVPHAFPPHSAHAHCAAATPAAVTDTASTGSATTAASTPAHTVRRVRPTAPAGPTSRRTRRTGDAPEAASTAGPCRTGPGTAIVPTAWASGPTPTPRTA